MSLDTDMVVREYNSPGDERRQRVAAERDNNVTMFTKYHRVDGALGMTHIPSSVASF